MTLPDSALVVAALSEAWGCRIKIIGIERIDPWSVARYHVEGGPQTTVIVKWVRPGDADDAGHRADPRQLMTEATALEFLAELGIRAAPKLITCQPGRFLIMEDQVGRRALDQVIKQDGYDDRAGARLRDFAATLARQHAATVGRSDRFQARLSRFVDPDPDRERRRFLGRGLDRTIEATAVLAGPEPSDEVWAEVAEIDRRLDRPGPFLALSNGDVGTNNFLVDGSGGTLIDYEFAGYRHCVTDLAEFYVPGPRWVTVDDPVQLGLEDTYREIAGGAIPEVLDDDQFGTDLAAACLTWGRIRLNNFPRIDARPAGDTSRLQRLITVESASVVAEAWQRFPALSEWLRAIGRALRRRWPDVDVDTARLGPFLARD